MQSSGTAARMATASARALASIELMGRSVQAHAELQAELKPELLYTELEWHEPTPEELTQLKFVLRLIGENKRGYIISAPPELSACNACACSTT